VATHGKDFVILACTVLIQYSSVTDRRTDAQATANTREAFCYLSAIAHKNCEYRPSLMFTITCLVRLYLCLNPNVVRFVVLLVAPE